MKTLKNFAFRFKDSIKGMIIRLKLFCTAIVSWLKPFSVINILFYMLIFIASLLVGVICLALIFPLSPSMNPVQLTTSEAIISDSTPFKDYLIILGFMAAALTLTYNIRRHLSEDYYKEAKSQLEKAFNTLVIDKAHVTNDRLKWLTCARLLLSAERIGNKIIMSSHKYIYKEDKQYWRVKLVEVVTDFDEYFYLGGDGGFFEESPGVVDKVSLDSLLVVHKFMQWDEAYADPLGHQLLNADQERHILHFYPKLHKIIIKERQHFKE